MRAQQTQSIETVVAIKTTTIIIKDQFDKMYPSGCVCVSFSNFVLLLYQFILLGIDFILMLLMYFCNACDSFYRKIWSRIYGNPQIKDQYTALLGIPKASRLDEGVYTCQVSHLIAHHCQIKCNSSRI